MDEAHKLGGIKFSKLVIYIYILILISAVKFAFSQPSATDCVLNYGELSSLYNSSCYEGDWGGFLNNSCCGGIFQDYLYALAQRANQTGQIYVNSTEQRKCLTIVDSGKVDVFGCGIEKLTSGGGGCSDFSVNRVIDRLGENVESLKKNCEVLDSREWNQQCGSCVRSWEEIEGINSNNGESIETESDICRFAVLVTVISTNIEDETWIQEIFKCLGQQDHDEDMDSGKVAGNSKISTGLCITIGGIIGTVVGLIIYIWILSRRGRKSNKPKKQDVPNPALPKKSGRLRVPIKEIYSATNNLNELNFIGEGTSGKVYKGVLSNNQHVAVKHIINDGCVETFLREVRSLSHVRHPNLVALLGYCENKYEFFLVYELCPNGNLSKWLFGKDKVLSWIQRLEIATDGARGLWFLHTYPQGCIVHRDIKPTNILLGTNFEAKLSDFGLSKVIDLGESYVSSEVRGTFGYVDPEYQSNCQVNSAGDVYSFGIVLLQILSGRKVINMNVKKPMPLDKMAKSLTREGSILGFVDPKLDGEYSEEAFQLTFKLALSCISLRKERPSMEQVVVKLEEALDISTRARALTLDTTTDRSSIPCTTPD